MDTDQNLPSPTPATEPPTAGSHWIQQLVEAQARNTPDAIALESAEGDLTYRQLDRRANRLSHRLQRLGVRPEELVGICLDPGHHLIIAILATLKAGAAYLPLDPSYPKPRLQAMADDARLRWLVTHRDSSAAPEGPTVVEPVPAELEPEEHGDDSPPPLPSNPGGEALAYVIYTSGSTGRPKGVAVPHRGLFQVAAAQRRLFDIGTPRRLLLWAPASFDASVGDWLNALANGGTLVLAPREQLLPGPDFVRLLRDRRIDLLVLPPSVLDALPAETAAQLPDLRDIVCAGEALSMALIQRWAPGRRMFNFYGPTEATIWSTWAQVTESLITSPPIGQPLRGVTIQLVGPSLHPVDSEIPVEKKGSADRRSIGEMLIGGLTVTRGYLGRPGLTAERFLPDPQSVTPGARVYRTGDLAHRRADGQLEFVGRKDHQIKVRGLRIEPGEIEAALRSHPRIASAVALPGAEGRQLLAYTVSEGEAATTAELRKYLGDRLPRHMVPDLFIPLPELPLTANGKLDRAALPAANAEAGASGDAPASPTERQLASLWRQVLSLDGLSRDDDFFALGGHSLMVGQLLSRIRQQLGASLDLKEVFAASTLREMAARIDAIRSAAEAGTDEAPDSSMAAAGGTGGVLSPPPIRRHGAIHQVPLSFPQQRVWFLDRLVPGNIAYNANATVDFTGPLHPRILEDALQEIVRRHQIFRTTFHEQNGRPVQDVHPSAPVTLPVVDLSRVPEDHRREHAESLVRQEMSRPFRLGQLPLARWKLLRLAPEEHLLIQVEHHFVHDGWAFGVLMGEIKTLYDAFARGLPSPLPEPPVQYTDFALWQQEWLQGEVLEEHLEAWSRMLEGLPPTLELPTDHPRPRTQTLRGKGPRIELGEELGARLRSFARLHGLSLYVLMMAGFYALLHRYTGVRDAAVGTAMANRPLPELEQMPGMVVNTMVLRTRMEGNPGLLELARRVQESALKAWKYQSVPLEKLVERIAPDRDLSRNPLFQVMFSFHDSPVPDLEMKLPEGTLRGRIVERHNGSAKADLNIVVIPRAEQRAGQAQRPGDNHVSLIWEYNSQLFDDSTIERMIGHYRNLLESGMAAPEREVSALTMLSDEEEQQLELWQRPSHKPDLLRQAPVVHHAFLDHARRAPDEPAIQAGSVRWTYDELEQRSGALAADLRRRGVGPEKLVAVFCPRSSQLVLAALAVLRAGGAYMPLDPGAPRDRLKLLLEDSRASWVLAHPALRDTLPEPEGWELLELPEDDAPLPPRQDGSQQARIGLDREPEADQLAYVIYTSGSTGKPKAVAIPHRGLSNLSAWTRQVLGVSAMDRATLMANPSFDASVVEIWPYLSAGAELLIPEEAVRSNPAAIPPWLTEHTVTVCFLPTPLAEVVLDSLRKGDSATAEGGAKGEPAWKLRHLLTGGDRLHRLPPASLGIPLINLYGPTEASVVTTYGTLPSETDQGAESDRSPSIGRPVANVRAYILDGRGRKLPWGLPGELFLGGIAVGRGYLHRPGLTAERFLPDPWSPESGARMYRSGDLVKLRPDGNLEYLGRVDHQVKVRGFRIELGEIEAALLDHPAVAQAVVVAADAAGGKALAAYAVASEGARPLPAEDILEQLRRALPAYMVPSTLMELAELPLSSNGKVDRRRLPEPEFGASEAAFEEPDTEVEELVAEIWREVLERQRVGATDHFFDLGGHSLLAARVLARVRDEIGLELPLQTFFEAPTVRQLAHEIEEQLLAAG
ncbi:MAG: amino acid adenylation domain-containing protein [Acidobacteriota bacterium]|nr:amino acid adenylation domain-containing protein [Acidobacteriota bacterium]